MTLHRNLRKVAQGRDCLIRVPGYCNGNPETTVLAHARLIGISGMSLKVPDALGAHGCSDCHDVVDGRRKTEFTPEQRRLMLLEGVLRTQAVLIELGLLRW